MSDGGAAAALTRAQLECANGVMIPGLVTDVAASMFAAWAASGDATYMRWLSDALGGDGDGFPRRGTTAAQKGEFSRALLAQPPAPGEGEGEGGGGGIGGRDLAGRLAKMDLRRFKRTLKAFCGGRKPVRAAAAAAAAASELLIEGRKNSAASIPLVASRLVLDYLSLRRLTVPTWNIPFLLSAAASEHARARSVSHASPR